MTIRELQRELPQFDWKKYIYSLFKDIENVTITENEILLIDDWKYLEKAIKLYAVVSKSNKKYENIFFQFEKIYHLYDIISIYTEI
jgi:hypothetical protein